MTNEEIRIKVAEAMGLKFVRAGHIKMPNAQEMWPDHWQDTRGKRKRIDGSIVGITVALPNYPESLDACAEFRKTLTDTEKERYVWWLNHLHSSADIHYTTSEKHIRREVFDLIDVEPTEHCLAYLKMKGIIP